jgi:hypothetical protein
MIACCGLTYEKYLDENGNVDIEVLKLILEKARDTKSFEERLKNLCKCSCHNKGWVMLH